MTKLEAKQLEAKYRNVEAVMLNSTSQQHVVLVDDSEVYTDYFKALKRLEEDK